MFEKNPIGLSGWANNPTLVWHPRRLSSEKQLSWSDMLKKTTKVAWYFQIQSNLCKTMVHFSTTMRLFQESRYNLNSQRWYLHWMLSLKWIRQQISAFSIRDTFFHTRKKQKQQERVLTWGRRVWTNQHEYEIQSLACQNFD